MSRTDQEQEDGWVSSYAENYFSKYKGRSVPLEMLLAYLSVHHFHDEDLGGGPFVRSMDLEEWAFRHAVEDSP